MTEVIELDIQPFSINAMYTTNMRAKTTNARLWTASVFHLLWKPEIQQKLKNLREQFDPLKHEFHLELTVFYPAAVYRTKEGTISGKTLDLTNWEKPLVDLLFDKKYANIPHPYGAPNIGHNDKYITSVVSKKKSGPDYKIIANISIIDQNLDPV